MIPFTPPVFSRLGGFLFFACWASRVLDNANRYGWRYRSNVSMILWLVGCACAFSLAIPLTWGWTDGL
jgi:hypothetical protein